MIFAGCTQSNNRRISHKAVTKDAPTMDFFMLQLCGVFLHNTSSNYSKPEIVETTFRSRFRFRLLKYPLFKKVVSFRVPEIYIG